MVLELTHIAPTGEAIGKYEGLVVFVPYGMPGDLVEVEIVHRRRNFARGHITSIVRPSPSRITPQCKYFGICGGCEWQHISYEQQLTYKTQAVSEQLRRIGKLNDISVANCVASPDQYFYRNHTQFVRSPNGIPGYRKANSHNVIEVDNCPIISSDLNTQLQIESRSINNHIGQSSMAQGDVAGSIDGEIHLRSGINTGEHTVFITNPDGAVNLRGDTGVIHERVGSFTYRISAGSFFQINTSVAELLVSIVVSAMDVNKDNDVLDLYCGVGLFTVPIAARARFVLGVESSTSATADAKANLSEFPNASIVTADVADALNSRVVKRNWDAILVDPPRAGVNFDTLHKLLRLKPGRVVYVSCDPATLARDARIICEQGYKLIQVQPLDMFPQTHHVETVATFIQRSAA